MRPQPVIHRVMLDMAASRLRYVLNQTSCNFGPGSVFPTTRNHVQLQKNHLDLVIFSKDCRICSS